MVSRSSTDVEYLSLFAATVYILWIQTLLKELSVSHQITIVLCDNLSVVHLAHNSVLHAKSGQMELDMFFVRDKILAKKLLVRHIPGQDQWANLLTKLLSPTRFSFIKTKLNVVDLPLVSHPP
nr:Copia protein [Cajanus cajan]